MNVIYNYEEVLLDEFYLDSKGEVRRSKDGYLGRFKKGDLAKFFINDEGYLKIQVPKHRATINKSHLVILLQGIDIPEGYHVDHIDGNKQNDHPSNLRVVNERTNHCNRKMRSDNTSGITGIRWSEYHGHYVIRRTVNGKRLSRSRKTLEQAKIVLDELTKMDTAYTARHGK